MKAILIALLLGSVAGAIDTLPMIRNKNPKYAVLLVFSQWILIGLVIPFVKWPMVPWGKGLVLGMLGMTPIMILVSSRNRRLIIPTGLCGAVLGALVGFFSSVLI